MSGVPYRPGPVDQPLADEHLERADGSNGFAIFHLPSGAIQLHRPLP
ncbi:hypothetical protein ACN6K9_008227 [Streptomyces sp. SAS_267]